MVLANFSGIVITLGATWGIPTSMIHTRDSKTHAHAVKCIRTGNKPMGIPEMVSSDWGWPIRPKSMEISLNIYYVCLFHVSNSVLFLPSTKVLSFSIDVALAFPIWLVFKGPVGNLHESSCSRSYKFSRTWASTLDRGSKVFHYAVHIFCCRRTACTFFN